MIKATPASNRSIFSLTRPDGLGRTHQIYLMRYRAFSIAFALGLAVWAFLLVPDARGAAPSETTVGGIVSLGDSYISGEAGRWAGNSDGSYKLTDALGPSAYFDNPDHTAELIPGCHRSRSAEVVSSFVGNDPNFNFACSGATVDSTFNDGKFKPGLDFFHEGDHESQVLMLKSWAAIHNVNMVVLSIGGNDFHFGEIVASCVRSYINLSIYTNCKNNPDVYSNISDRAQNRVATAVERAIRNIHDVMSEDGYVDDRYLILVQDYEAPIPAAYNYRYPESDLLVAPYIRQSVGGCGFTNVDADWAHDTVLPTVDNVVKEAAATSLATIPNVRFLQLDRAFAGHELCEKTDTLVGSDQGFHTAVPVPSRWDEPGAVDRVEWISQIRVAARTPYYRQEALHPNYWGELALRNCLSQVISYNTLRLLDDQRGGECVDTGRSGLNARGEPNMTFIPSPSPTARTGAAQ